MTDDATTGGEPRDGDAERLARKVVAAIEARISADGWSPYARQSLCDVIAPIVETTFATRDAALREKDAEIARLKQASAVAGRAKIEPYRNLLARASDTICKYLQNNLDGTACALMNEIDRTLADRTSEDKP